MHPTVKIICTLFLVEVMVQSADSFPQFSIPFVSWNNKNKEEPAGFPLNIKIQNPLSSIFAKNSNSRQYEKTSGNNDVVNNNEKIITVTPHAGYIANKNKYEEHRQIIQTTQDPSNTYVKQNHGFKAQQRDNQNVKNINNIKETEDNPESQFNFNEDDVIRIFEDIDGTTESTTEYESTTEDLSGLNRSGVSGHVVASLLG